MAKDKEKTLNPAAQQRKLEKQKALKKGKAAVAAQRNERLATRNPHRLESQIAELQALKDSQGGKLGGRETRQLEDLERDIVRIKKARENLGDRAPHLQDTKGRERRNEQSDRGREPYRRFDNSKKRPRENDQSDASDETNEEVRRIPWPRDTPPPIPGEEVSSRYSKGIRHGNDAAATSANVEPLGKDRNLPDRPSDLSLPPEPVTSANAPRTIYESKAQVRNLRTEATSAFVPAVVRRNIDAVKGKLPNGGLLEEEDLEKLEKSGYVLTAGVSGTSRKGGESEGDQVTTNGGSSLDAELAAWEAEVAQEARNDEAGEAQDAGQSSPPRANISDMTARKKSMQPTVQVVDYDSD